MKTSSSRERHGGGDGGIRSAVRVREDVQRDGRVSGRKRAGPPVQLVVVEQNAEALGRNGGLHLAALAVALADGVEAAALREHVWEADRAIGLLVVLQ